MALLIYEMMTQLIFEISVLLVMTEMLLIEYGMTRKYEMTVLLKLRVLLIYYVMNKMRKCEMTVFLKSRVLLTYYGMNKMMTKCEIRVLRIEYELNEDVVVMGYEMTGSGMMGSELHYHSFHLLNFVLLSVCP